MVTTLERPKYKFVIVDDDYIFRFVLKYLLSNYFYKPEIYTSEDGTDGLGLIFIVNPALVIIDTTIPKYDGLEVTEYIASNEKIKASKTSIILLKEDQFKTNLEGQPNIHILNKSDKNFLFEFKSLFYKGQAVKLSFKE